MIGAIIGDIVGSVYEHGALKTTDFPLFQGVASLDYHALTQARRRFSHLAVLRAT